METPAIRVLFAIFALALGLATNAGEPPPEAKREIGHLLDYLGHSGCQFNRNGTWYGPAEARSHLQNKLDGLSRTPTGLKVISSRGLSLNGLEVLDDAGAA